MSSGLALAFVLLEEAEPPDSAALVVAAAELGLTLRPDAVSEEGAFAYQIDGGGFVILMVMPAPHPDAPQMPRGLASPDEDELSDVEAHIIVTAQLPEGLDTRTADAVMARITAAVVEASPSVAAMLGHGVVFHNADFFTKVVAEGGFPLLVCVDVTAGPEPDDRVSFLTHGLQRYGREEFYLTASRSGQGAVDFLLAMAEWVLVDPDKQLPTGDTVGRTPDEQVIVQRVPSPVDGAPDVVRLDLD